MPPELVGALIQDSVPVAVAPHEPPPLDPALFSDWSTYEEAVKRSRETGRPVLLAFTAVGCETCESLRASVFREEAASVTMRSVRHPGRGAGRVRTKEAMRAGGTSCSTSSVTTFPTLVVWSPTTKRVRTLKGYRGVAATLRFITDAASAVD